MGLHVSASHSIIFTRISYLDFESIFSLVDEEEGGEDGSKAKNVDGLVMAAKTIRCA